MESQLAKLLEFNRRFRVPFAVFPSNISTDTLDLRVKLLCEELLEYSIAAGSGDLEAVSKELSDLLYVLLGTIVAHGLQYHIEDIFAEVHRSNMSKLDEYGNPIFREDGKVLKSSLYTPPNILSILNKGL